MLSFASSSRSSLMHARTRAAWLAIRPFHSSTHHPITSSTSTSPSPSTSSRPCTCHRHFSTTMESIPSSSPDGGFTTLSTLDKKNMHPTTTAKMKHLSSSSSKMRHKGKSSSHKMKRSSSSSSSSSSSLPSPPTLPLPPQYLSTLTNYQEQIDAEQHHLASLTSPSTSTSSLHEDLDQKMAQHTSHAEHVFQQYQHTWKDISVLSSSSWSDESVTSSSPSFLSDPTSTDTLYYHQFIHQITSDVYNQLSRNHSKHLEWLHEHDITHMATSHVNEALHQGYDLWTLKATKLVQQTITSCHDMVNQYVMTQQLAVLQQEQQEQKDGIEKETSDDTETNMETNTDEISAETVTQTNMETNTDTTMEEAKATTTTSTSTSTSTTSSTPSTTSATTTPSHPRPPRVLTPAQLAAAAANTAAQRASSAARRSHETLFREQLSLETRVLQQSVDRYKEMSKNLISLNLGGTMKPAQRVLLTWYNALYEKIVAEQQICMRKPTTGERTAYASHITRLPAAELTVVVIHEMLSLAVAHPTGIAFTQAALAVGKAVNNECTLAQLRDNKALMRVLLNECHVSEITLPVLYRCASRLEGSKWGVAVHVKLGAALISMLIKAAVVPEFEKTTGKKSTPTPAFTHKLVEIHYPKPRSVGMIFCDPQVVTRVLQSPQVMDHLSPKFMPMVVPPRKWTAHDEGGYYSIRSRIMRTQGSVKQTKALQNANLQRIYDGLNYLGTIPWKINTRIYEVMKILWERGGGVGEIPSQHIIPEPIEPHDMNDRNMVRQYKTASHKIRQSNAELHSQRCDFRYKLQVAEEFKGRTIYYPCNIDFRGRVYPISPHLNHIGSDICRGLLTFAEAKPLGIDGLRWFKIHTASLFGKNKLPFVERVAWTEQHIEQVMACADDPINNTWWLQADDPWQFLATCFELTNAMRSPDPTQYASALPIHQDGSCNGLQHYAAMGRDEWGGSCVNLTPSDRPQDVYMSVCNQVNARLTEEAAKGNEMAKMMAGKITRKIVKQTVMTSVYGVTHRGARDQILNRLEETTDIAFPEPRESSMATCAQYLSRVTLESLSDLFHGARAIMDWLKTCAEICAKNQQPVAWITPLGLPVVQPYRRATTYQITTLMQKVCIADHSDLLPVSGSKQVAAFPPNFVHSLDATHMLLTALDCRDNGITFTAVHDSYWTHACDMSRMNASLRQQFVDLYSLPILEELRDGFVSRFPGVEFPPLPARGTLDIQKVKESPYFFN